MATDKHKLSVEDQDNFLRNIKGSAQERETISTAILNGVLDPLPVIMHRRAVKEFVTTHPPLIAVRDKAVKLSERGECVLVLGESGTGKELIARILHGVRKGEFVAVNVCAVTDTLFESELFGHVRGSFTGADRDRDGLIAQARGGTLFLDEIGDMPLHLQAKILRMIQQRVYRKVGSNVDYNVECRIVAATHRNLREMIEQKTFRLDLYERLNVFNLTLTPLRNRLEDMVNYVPKEFADCVMETIRGVVWTTHTAQLSGNIRQLLNLKLRWEVFGELPTVEDIL